MRKILIYGFALLSTATVFAFPAEQKITASPTVAGIWRVTFYLEPGRGTGATQCIVFTNAPGIVSGVPTSGTWYSPTFPGWQGQWIQVGDHIRWVGVTNALATSESGNIANASTFGGVSFNHFFKTNAANSSAGSWFAVKVRSCAGIKSHASNDPSKY